MSNRYLLLLTLVSVVIASLDSKAQVTSNLSYRISHIENDATGCGSSSFSYFTNYNQLGSCTFNNKTYTPYFALRFNDLKIDASNKIDSAFVQFTASGGADTVDVPIWISTQRSVYPPVFGAVSSAADIRNRPRTRDTIDWRLRGAWDTGYRGRNAKTPNLAPLLNEIVGLEGWSKGDNAAVFIFEQVKDSLSYDQVLFHAYGYLFSPESEMSLPTLNIYLAADSPSETETKLLGNPLRPDSRLQINLPDAATTRWDVYDTTGRKVYGEASFLDAGYHSIELHSILRLPSGIYFLHVQTPSYRRTIKLLHLR